MPPHTRRRLLQGLVGAAVGLAGCSGASSDRSATGTPAADRNSPDRRKRPEYRMLRGTSGGPVAWFADNENGTPATAVERSKGQRSGLIASETTAGTLRFLDVDGAVAAQSFVANTDFDSETIYLEQRRVGACYVLDLCWVSWEDGIETSYGRRLRDHDVACETDVRHTLAVLVRLPVTLDTQEIHSSGTRISSDGCRQPRESVQRAPADRGVDTNARTNG